MNEKRDKSQVIRIRFPISLYNWVKKRAKIEMRPVSKQIAFYVYKALQEENRLQEKAEQLSPEREEGRERSGGGKRLY